MAQLWREDRTARGLVLSTPGNDVARETVLAQVESLRTVTASAVGLAPDVEPVTVWLYPNAAALLADKPLVVALGSELAYPRRSRREVILLAAPEQSAEEILGALRLELAHRALVVRSDGRLPEGFQAGLAAYLAGIRPGEAAGVARLREAWSRDALIPWSDLAVPGAAYLEPGLTYPQSRSVAQFLLATHGLMAVRRWLDAAAETSGWRQALESAFGQSPDRLEAAWAQWLPAYLDGGWRSHLLFTADLKPAERLLARGEYAAAAALVAGVGAFEPAAAASSEALRLRADAGLQGVQRLAEAQDALQAGDYDGARRAASQARALLAEAGDTGAMATAAELARRAELGAASLAALRQAEALPAWRALEARAKVAGAAAGLSALGHDAAADRARAVLQVLDRRLVPAGVALFAAGLGLLLWSLRRRRQDAMADAAA